MWRGGGWGFFKVVSSNFVYSLFGGFLFSACSVGEGARLG